MSKKYRTINSGNELLKEIYQLFKNLDLFSAHSFEEFAEKASQTTQLNKVLLVDILKNFRNARPTNPAISITPVNPITKKIYDDYKKENEPDLTVGGLQIATSSGQPIDIGKSEFDASNVQYYYDEVDGSYKEGEIQYYYDDDDQIQERIIPQQTTEVQKEDTPFIVHFDPASVDYWDSPRIWLPYLLIYYVRNYYSRFLEMMEDYYDISNFEQATIDELLPLFLDTNLIKIVSYDPSNNSHVLQMNRLVMTIHEIIKKEAGEKYA